MNINLHHLRLFHYVADARGISAAVKIIPYGIQQPAISQQLLQLEKELGVKLFERRPFALTTAGERLYKFTTKAFNDLELTLRSIKDDVGIRFRVACPSVVSVNFLPEIIADILEEFPFLRPNVLEMEGNAVFGALMNRDIDIAITMADIPRSKLLSATKIISLPFALVVPDDHRFVKKGFWAKSDFATERWIAIQEDTGGVDDLKIGLLNLGVVPDFSASTNSIEAALNYVAMGIGIALMALPPESMLTHRKLKAIPVAEEFGTLDIKVVRLKNNTLDKQVVQSFIATTKQVGERIRKFI
jgi:DNA-binding transcriptional LysR family regulator